jgi:hypothetical protein
MKKIALVFAALSVVAAAGCTSASTQLCLKSAECAEEEDPAAFCEDAEADCDADCTTVKGACSAEQDAVNNCLIANGTCDTIDGVDGNFFGLEALAADGACETEGKDSADCAIAALE